jgi:type VI secretion system protein ImpH
MDLETSERRRSSDVIEEETEEPLPSVEERVGALLKQAPYARFFTFISMVERLTPEAVRVGGAGPPSKEGIRFRHDPDLAFASGDMTSAHILQVPSRAGDPLSPPRPLIEITTTFLGLSGSSSPLPTYLAEEIAQEDPHQPTRRDFLDIFHHRLVSLLFRWWARYGYAREFESGMGDRWSLRALAFTGSDAFHAPASKHIPPWQILRLLPLMAGKQRSARTLRIALQEILGHELPGIQVSLEQFVGGWVPVDEAERCKLGVARHRLGGDALLGGRVFDRSGSFTIKLEPVSRAAYPRLLPNGDLMPVLKDTVRLFTRDAVDFDLELVLAKDAIPTLYLARKGGSKLAHDAWLRSDRATQSMTFKDVMSSGK